MKRLLLITGLSLAVLLTSVTVLVNVQSGSAGELPPPDPSLPIRMPDGTDLPLSEALDHLRKQTPQPNSSRQVTVELSAPEGHAAPSHSDAHSGHSVKIITTFYGPTFSLAEQELNEGRLDQALALYQSIGEDDPSYALARRRIGWHILADRQNRPEQGVPFVQEALLADPCSGNCWHDLARVYSATLGFDMH